MASKKVIKIKCEGTKYIDFHELHEFQEDIKKIDKKKLEKLKSSLIKGIKAPQFVWKAKGKFYILDGHQRNKAFYSLEESGWYIPNVPVVEIFAETKKEAKQNVLIYVSQHGDVNKEKLELYISRHDINLQNIIIRTEPIKLKMHVDKQIKTEKLQAYKKMHILLSFNPDKLLDIKPHLEKIKKIEGIEIEQGEN